MVSGLRSDLIGLLEFNSDLLLDLLLQPPLINRYSSISIQLIPRLAPRIPKACGSIGSRESKAKVKGGNGCNQCASISSPKKLTVGPEDHSTPAEVTHFIQHP